MRKCVDYQHPLWTFAVSKYDISVYQLVWGLTSNVFNVYLKQCNDFVHQYLVYRHLLVKEQQQTQWLHLWQEGNGKSLFSWWCLISRLHLCIYCSLNPSEWCIHVVFMRVIITGDKAHNNQTKHTSSRQRQQYIRRCFCRTSVKF